MLKGRLLVGQSGGCTQVINASLAGVVEQAARTREVTGIWGMVHGVEGALRGEMIDLACEGRERMRAIAQTPSAALGSCRRKLGEKDVRALLEICRANDIRCFIYIGGNDSADSAHRLAMAAVGAQYDLRVVSVPKTIDNDLPVTDHCPGYGSTARFIASTVADTGLDTEAMASVDPIKIVEVMGRNAGWLPAAAALAKRTDGDAPQFIWPPEIPFEEKRFLELVRDGHKRLGYCVAVVAETLRDAQGRPVSAKGRNVARDAFGHPRLVGAAEYLCELVNERLGLRARFDKPGTIQRMSSAHISRVDLSEARACGAWAVRLAVKGMTDCMVVMRRASGATYRIRYEAAPLQEIANTEKRLPPGWFDTKRMLPTAAFRRYALPLVGDALPQHARLKGVRVKGHGSRR